MSQMTMKERLDLFAKCGAFGDLEDLMLQESNISFLLVEQLENQDVEKLRSSITATMGVLDDVKGKIGNSFPSLGAYLDKNKLALSKAEELASKIDLSDPKGLKGFLGSMFGDKVDIGRALQGVLEIESKANQSLNTFKSAIPLIARNLKGKVERETQLSQIPADVGITSDQLRGGVTKAFGSAGKKGMFAKMAGFFKGKAAKIPGAEDPGEFPTDSFADELLELTYGDLEDLVSAVEAVNLPEPAQDAIEDVNAAAQEAEGSDDPLAGTPAEVDTGEESGEKAKEAETEDTDTISTTKNNLVKKATDAAGKPGGLIISKLIDMGTLKDAGLEIAEESFYRKDLTNLLFEQIKISHEKYQAAVDAVAEEDESAFEDVDLDDVREKLGSLDDPALEIEAKKINPKELSDKAYRQGKFIVTMDGKELAQGRPTQIADVIAMELTKDEDLQQDFAEDAEIEVDGGGGLKIPFTEMEDLVGRINKDLEAGKYGETGFKLGASTDGDADDADAIGAALEKAVANVSGETEAPAVAIGHALDGWHSGLSQSAQSVLKAKGRFDGLKTAVDTSLSNAANAIAGEVQKAVDTWWKEHEATLVKSKKFSKTNGETLRAEIPKIAAAMLQQKSENKFPITKYTIRRVTNKYLSKKYYSSNLIQESSRWKILAGIEK
jgi:hypothetical protein